MKILVLLALAQAYDGPPEACTAIIMGRKATSDGSTIVTQTADCYNCDYRLAKVTEHESPHTVRLYKATYPAEVSKRSATWNALEFTSLDVDKDEAPFQNLEMAKIQEKTWRSDDWAMKHTVGSIPVEELYALAKSDEEFESFENLYAIQNSGGLTMAETTCEATLIGREPRPCATCEGPLVDVGALSKMGMRVCKTARCAIRVMGSIAEKYGYYGAELKPSEAGEALVIADGIESWIWHIIPDTTGLSAIWVAQQVPEDSVAVCANSFVIRGIPEPSDFLTKCLNEEEEDCDILLSSNVHEEAKKQEQEKGVGRYPIFRDAAGQLDFAATFGPRPSNTGFPYSTHRVWRVMSLLAPEKTKAHVLASKADYLGSELPFAVAVEAPVTVEAVLNIQRDYYEGTNFDLTKGLAAGPWGDPTRYDGTWTTDKSVDPRIKDVVPGDNVKLNEGRFERAISMFRTSYCIVVQSFAAEKPPVLWFSQGTPHAGVFVPLRLDKGDVPLPFRTGSLYEYSSDSMFWRTQLIANWMRANNFRLARDDVKAAQLAFESAELKDTDDDNAGLAAKALTAWQQLGEKLITKYHDGFRLMTSNDESLIEPDVHRYFYPVDWLHKVGYYDPVKPDAYYTDLSEQSSSSTTPPPEKQHPPAIPIPPWKHHLTLSANTSFDLLTFAAMRALVACGLVTFGLAAGTIIERRRHRLP